MDSTCKELSRGYHITLMQNGPISKIVTDVGMVLGENSCSQNGGSS